MISRNPEYKDSTRPDLDNVRDYFKDLKREGHIPKDLDVENCSALEIWKLKITLPIYKIDRKKFDRIINSIFCKLKMDYDGYRII